MKAWEKVFMMMASRMVGLGMIAIIAANGSAFAAGGTQSSFRQVWSEVSTQPYSALPFHRVSLADFVVGGVDRMLQAGRETIASDVDLWPYARRKLIRPNGICLAGGWRITARETGYTGYFAPGAQGLIIARASVFSDQTRKGGLRSFGFAGKLFPTTAVSERVSTANFQLIDDNAGTMQPYFTRAALVSEPPFGIASLLELARRDGVGGLVDLVKTLLTTKDTQQKADPRGEVGLRQLYPIARIGVARIEEARAPALLKLTGAVTLTPSEAADFRDELRVANYRCGVKPNCLKFDIHVAPTRGKTPRWRRIGEIVFTADSASAGCDERLTFRHAPWDANEPR